MPVGYSIYVDKPSYFHRELDPRTKMVWMLTMFALSLLFNHPLPLALLLISTLLIGLVARLELRSLLPFLVSAAWFLVLGILIWPFYINQGLPLFRIFRTQITLDGLLFGLAMGIRVALMVTAAGILMMATSPEKMMLGLLKIGLPYKVGMALSTAIRFVPLINSERLTITEAQRTRGLNLEKGSSFSKAVKYVGIIGPLLLRTFDLMQSLAIAMDCRGFGARSGRTSITEIGIKRIDKYIIAACLVCIGIGAACRILGIGILIKGYL